MKHSDGTPTQRRGAKAFAIAIAVSQACALVRYIVLARILGPVELGWAVMIVLIGQFFDSVTDSGSDRFLIQDEAGDEPEAQKLVHLLALTRGAVTASSLVLFAAPIANFLEAPAIVPGLRLLALAPLASGFIHLDLRRIQRHHDFRIEGRATLLAETVSLATTTTAALVTHSYLAIVFGLIARAVMLAATSQLMARRPFRAWPSRRFAIKLGVFGAPLMVNGLVLFFGSQGDRVLISKLLGAAEVGRYSAAMLLIFYPIMVLQRYIAGLYLPQMTRANPARLANADALGGIVVVIASLATLGFALVAPVALPILFGNKFRQGLVIIALVGVLNAARFLKLWPVNMLLAEGRSHGVLITNFVRLSAIPLAIAGTWLDRSLTSIVLAFVTGELVSLMIGVWLASRALSYSLTAASWRIGLFVAAGLVATFGALAVQSGSLMGAGLVLFAFIAIAITVGRREYSALQLLIGLLPSGRKTMAGAIRRRET